MLQPITTASDCLAGRAILVTGAGQGLGRIAALAFAARGATVVLHGRKLAKLEAVYDEIEALGAATPAIVPLDFTKASEDEFRGLAEAIFASCRRLDGVFHAASHFSPLMSLDGYEARSLPLTSCSNADCLFPLYFSKRW